MRAARTPVLRDIVLIGGGHSHVGVIRDLATRPVAGVRQTVICTDTDTPYSGMLPGYVAGHYTFDDIHIDLRRLAEAAGARYFHDEVIGIDRAERRVICRHRPPVPYDVLSIDIGSTPGLARVPGAREHAIPVKPIRRFDLHWRALLERVLDRNATARIAVVGAGAGGVELLLAMQHRLRSELRARGRDPATVAFDLYSASAEIMPTHNARVRRAMEGVLRERGIGLHLSTRIARVEAGRLHTEAGGSAEATEILWVTQAGGAEWLRSTGLALDDSGFVRVYDTLRSQTDPLVFAAGDCASMIARPLEKAGVYAVRMGPPLAENLRRTLLREPLVRYRPQSRFLSLVSTGDRHAIASRGLFYARGDWVWRWKDSIDRRFMRRFAEFGDSAGAMASSDRSVPLDAGERTEAVSALAMRCGGCGAKVGAGVLSRALARLKPFVRDDVLVGLDARDDAAVVRVPTGRALLQSVDFFRAFIDDPWLFGRIAANHALGDIYAKGGEPQSASAIATIPPGLAAKIEDDLFQMMAGASSVFDEARCALVGGHTAEGAELGLGFAVGGLVDDRLQGLLRKDGMRAGQAIVLTKPLGTGVLLAAHARLEARGRWIDAALQSMQQSAGVALACLLTHEASACTDVTGFGLIGHLVDMLRHSAMGADLELDALPLLDGALDCARRHIASSMSAANIRYQDVLDDLASVRAHPVFPLLFDPQTAGGLLATVPEERAEACLAALRAAGCSAASIIGRVVVRVPGHAAIRCIARRRPGERPAERPGLSVVSST